MIGALLASYGFYGGEVGNFLSYLEQAGVFSYVLPFLLIFAIVFGILMRIQIFKDNKGLNAIIALVIGLMSLQFDFVPLFFSEIFPRVGVALSIILALLVLTGLFLDPKNKIVSYGLLITGVIIFLVVLIKSSGYLGWYSGYWWYAHSSEIIVIGVILVIIFAIINSFSNRKIEFPELKMLGFSKD